LCNINPAVCEPNLGYIILNIYEVKKTKDDDFLRSWAGIKKRILHGGQKNTGNQMIPFSTVSADACNSTPKFGIADITISKARQNDSFFGDIATQSNYLDKAII